MNITKQEKDYKEFLATQKRCNELWEELSKRSYIPLSEPFQKGWMVSFVLRDDIKRKENASHIQKALDLAQHVFYTRNLKVIKHIRLHKDFRKLLNIFYTNNKYKSDLPSLRLISEKVFKNLPLNISCFFKLDPESEKWKAFRGSKYYLSIPHYWLELKARPYFVTHILDKGGEVEQEYQYLRDKLRYYWLEYGTNYSSSYPAYKDRTKTRDKIQKFKKGEIDDISIEKIPKEYDW
jgi:hypothetical protein